MTSAMPSEWQHVVLVEVVDVPAGYDVYLRIPVVIQPVEHSELFNLTFAQLLEILRD